MLVVPPPPPPYCHDEVGGSNGAVVERRASGGVVRGVVVHGPVGRAGARAVVHLSVVGARAAVVSAVGAYAVMRKYVWRASAGVRSSVDDGFVGGGGVAVDVQMPVAVDGAGILGDVTW